MATAIVEKVNRALVFNIVHSSFVDGWGIRTTIFLKGCPLRCLWCCNPEGQKRTPELKVAAADCNGCGNCVSACELGALRIVNEKVSVDRSKCTGCGACCDICDLEALGIFGQWYTPKEIFEEIKKDIAYYQNSGGGVTIGGGEATLYPEFCLELIRLCHEENIKVAVDTCGYVTDPMGMEVLRQADLLLFDIKGLYNENHKRNTGVSNDVILANLRALDAAGTEFIVRMPLIPGHNDSKEELQAAAELLQSLHGLKRLDLLPYHTYGKSKYEELDMDYPLDCDLIPENRQEEILAYFRSFGLPAQVGG